MARRLRIYLFGFILGIILVIFLYGDKYDIITGWTPEKRVLKRLKLTEKEVSDSMQCILDCYNFDDKEWETLYTEGDVNFAEARKKPYPYYSVSIHNRLFNLRFLAKDSISVLVGFEGSEKLSCNCK